MISALRYGEAVAFFCSQCNDQHAVLRTREGAYWVSDGSDWIAIEADALPGWTSDAGNIAGSDFDATWAEIVAQQLVKGS